MNSPQDHAHQFEITDASRPFVIEWLRDRSAFHSWFTSLVTGSFVIITVFGRKPDFFSPAGIPLAIAVVLLLFSMLCNLVCVWSIPSWKYRVNVGIVTDGRAMRRELAITAWLGVVCFVCGLTIAVIGSSVS